MDIEDFLRNRWFTRSVIILWLISSIFALGLLRAIDGIVHETLYNYGLRFDLNWAEPYWNLWNLAFVCLTLPMVLGCLVLFLSFQRTHGEEKDDHNVKIQISESSETIRPLKTHKKETTQKRGS